MALTSHRTNLAVFSRSLFLPASMTHYQLNAEVGFYSYGAIFPSVFVTQHASCSRKMWWPLRKARLPGHILSWGFPQPVGSVANVSGRVGCEPERSQRWEDKQESNEKTWPGTRQISTLFKCYSFKPLILLLDCLLLRVSLWEPFALTGRVSWCQPGPTWHILAKKKF